jgi:hypothetical protein
MRPRGRPVGSQVRTNIIEILFFLHEAYGYEIYKHYCVLYPKVTLRLMYYHLARGVELGEFKIEKIDKQEGLYSWGKSSERTIYRLGASAKPAMTNQAKEYFGGLKK